MSERRSIRLDDDDLIAGAQILAWIALPHRPLHGVTLLNHWYWARKRHRGESLPPLPFVPKVKNRIENQLASFEKELRRAIRAGTWLELKLLSSPNRPPMFENLQFSTRGLASQWARHNNVDPRNAMRAIWSERKPVTHLALSAAREISERARCENWPGIDLERIVFHPDWVAQAIDNSELIAMSAERLGLFEPGAFFRFHRDSF